MALPEEIIKLIYQYDVPEGRSPNIACDGSKFHSPRPLVTIPTKIGNKLFQLCGNCRENLTLFIYLWDANGGLDWPAQRSFGNEIRRIGLAIIKSRENN